MTDTGNYLFLAAGSPPPEPAGGESPAPGAVDGEVYRVRTKPPTAQTEGPGDDGPDEVPGTGPTKN